MAILLHKALGALQQPDPAVLCPLAAVSLYTRCGPEIDELMFQPHPLSNSGNVWASRPPCPLSPSLPVTCWDTCVYVCERAWGIIEQTLLP